MSLGPGSGQAGPAIEVLPWIGNTAGSRTSGRRALVLPGVGYTVDHPLLFWTCQVLAAGDWQVHTVRWPVNDEAAADLQAFVERAADQAARSFPDARITMVVGKSLGTRAARWASERGYPGIWLTPLLRRPEVRDALLGYGRPALLIGGTADSTWDSAVAASTGQPVVEVPGADHALHVGTDWRASLAAITHVMERIEAFAGWLDEK